MFKVGEKVICIDDSPNPARADFTQWVVEGEIYTVRSIEGSWTGVKRVLLEELRNPKKYFNTIMGVLEVGFSHKRFVSYEDYIMGNVEEVEEEIEIELS